MSEIGRRPSWDSDEELLGDAPTFTFENDIENEDELLGCSDNETSADEDKPITHMTTPWSSKTGSQPYESQDGSCVQQEDSFRDGTTDKDDNYYNEMKPLLGNEVVDLMDICEPSVSGHHSEGELESSFEKGDHDEEEEEEEEGNDDDNSRGRSRFTSERNSLNISKSTSRANIPDTLEISKEDEKRIEEFVQGRGPRNRCKNERQLSHRQQANMQFSGQRGYHNNSIGLLRLPHNLNPNLIQRFPNQNYPGNLSQTLASAAINMIMDGSLHLRHRMDGPSLHAIIDHQSLPINRVQSSDNRLKAPSSLFSMPPSTVPSIAQNLVISGHTQLIQSGPRPVICPSRELSRIQAISHEMRALPTQLMVPQPTGLLPPLVQPRMIAPINNQQISIMSNPSNLRPGVFRPSILQTPNLNVPPPPHQQIPNSFIQQPVRLLVPMNQHFGGSTVAPFQGNPQQMQHRPHLRTIETNFNNPLFSSAHHEMVGQPIETVVLRQSRNKNKPNNKPNNLPLSSSIPPVPKQHLPITKPVDQSELEEARKLVRRAERFSKPVHMISKMTNQNKGEQEGINQKTHNFQKRASCSEMSEDDNPTKLMRSANNRKVIARSAGRHDPIFTCRDSLSSGDFRDFELMRDLEKQKKMREMVMKKKEESRLMQAQSKKNGSEVSSSIYKIILEEVAAPSSSPPNEIKVDLTAGSSQDDKSKTKNLKKVVMTKSQYKVLLQHMKSKGMPLPTSVKEVKQNNPTRSLHPNDAGSQERNLHLKDDQQRSTKDRRIVQLSPSPQLMTLPRLLPMPSLKVPEVMPLPPALAKHPRFSNSSSLSGIMNQSNVVILDGLSSTTKYTQLRSIAEKIGPVLNLQLVLSEQRALITFLNPQHAQIFANRYHGSTIEHSLVSATMANH